jgi:hypothetical protein
MPTKQTANRIREAQLLVSPPEVVARALAQYADENRESLGYGDESLEKGLLARGHPLINIALAQYACVTDVVHTLYEMGKSEPTPDAQERYLLGLRIACLSNESRHGLLAQHPRGIIDDDEFARLLVNDSEGYEIGALLANANLNPELLVSLFLGKKPYEALSDERRSALVQLAADNPRLTTNYDSVDGPDLQYWALQKAIITMLGTVLVSDRWHYALNRVFDQLDPFDVHLPDGTIAASLERWLKAPQSDNVLLRDGHYTPLSGVQELMCLVAAMYGAYYSKEDNKYRLIIIGNPDSSDVVFRCAHYGRAVLDQATMTKAFAKDGDAYSYAAMCNRSLYLEPMRRKLFEEQQLRGDLRYLYQRRCEQLRKHHPDFDTRPVAEWLIEEAPKESKELEALTSLQVAGQNIEKRLARCQTWLFWGLIVVIGLLLIVR